MANQSSSASAGDAGELKNRRRGKTTHTAPDRTALSDEPAPEQPDTVSEAIARTSDRVLFSPGEKAAVIQSGGHVPPATLEDYVEAETDATESMTPHHASTPVTVQLWPKGALVRKDIYELHRQQQGG
jgi:hypothetical protein